MVINTLKTITNSTDIKQGITLAAATSAIKIIKNTKTFINIWDIAIGNKLEAWNQKSIFKNQQDIENYKNEYLNKISQIPSEKFQEPKLSVIGPALEASKFYIEEKEIRLLFVNLISSSMNSNFNSRLHHSFVEIIKQLSPYDAKILSTLDSNPQPIVDIIIKKGTTDGILYFEGICTLYQNLYFSDSISENDSNNISIDNLIRLNLINLIPSGLTNSELYKHYLDSNTFKSLSNRFPDQTLTIQKMAIQLTSFGEAFKNICCEQISE